MYTATNQGRSLLSRSFYLAGFIAHPYGCHFSHILVAIDKEVFVSIIDLSDMLQVDDYLRRCRLLLHRR